MTNFSFGKRTKACEGDLNYLRKFDYAQDYFLRNFTFEVTENMQVMLKDLEREHLLNLWASAIYMQATGEKTVEQFLCVVADSYTREEQTPKNLAEILCTEFDILQKSNIIRFVEKPHALPYYLRFALAEQDAEKANKLMEIDGFTRKLIQPASRITLPFLRKKPLF